MRSATEFDPNIDEGRLHRQVLGQCFSMPSYKNVYWWKPTSLMVGLTHDHQIGPCMSHIAVQNSFRHASHLDTVGVQPRTNASCNQKLCRHVGLAACGLQSSGYRQPARPTW